jgi:hypothetical protein
MHVAVISSPKGQIMLIAEQYIKEKRKSGNSPFWTV